MDSILKMGLVFFVCLLSFAVGTFVGKKFSDYNHQVAVYEPKKEGEAAEAETSETSKEEAATPAEAKADGGKMTDSDVAEIAKEFATPEATESAANPAAEERNPSSEGGSMPSGFSKVEGRKEVPAAAEAEQNSESKMPLKPVAKAVSEPASSVQMADGEYTIQIASLPTEKEAKQKASQLKEQNYVAFYVPAKVNGKVWYRVNVGMFSNADEAKKFKTEKLAMKPEYSAAIVQKVVRGPSSAE